MAVPVKVLVWCVGFLYAVVNSELVCPGETKVSTNVWIHQYWEPLL